MDYSLPGSFVHGLLQARTLTGVGSLQLSSVAQSYLTPSDPMDCSPSGFSVHEILQASILEWIAISFSRESSQARDFFGRNDAEAETPVLWPPHEKS